MGRRRLTICNHAEADVSTTGPAETGLTNVKARKCLLLLVLQNERDHRAFLILSGKARIYTASAEGSGTVHTAATGMGGRRRQEREREKEKEKEKEKGKERMESEREREKEREGTSATDSGTMIPSSPDKIPPQAPCPLSSSTSGRGSAPSLSLAASLLPTASATTPPGGPQWVPKKEAPSGSTFFFDRGAVVIPPPSDTPVVLPSLPPQDLVAPFPPSSAAGGARSALASFRGSVNTIQTALMAFAGGRLGTTGSERKASTTVGGDTKLVRGDGTKNKKVQWTGSGTKESQRSRKGESGKAKLKPLSSRSMERLGGTSVDKEKEKSKVEKEKDEQKGGGGAEEPTKGIVEPDKAIGMTEKDAVFAVSDVVLFAVANEDKVQRQTLEDEERSFRFAAANRDSVKKMAGLVLRLERQRRAAQQARSPPASPMCAWNASTVPNLTTKSAPAEPAVAAEAEGPPPSIASSQQTGPRAPPAPMTTIGSRGISFLLEGRNDAGKDLEETENGDGQTAKAASDQEAPSGSLSRPPSTSLSQSRPAPPSEERAAVQTAVEKSGGKKSMGARETTNTVKFEDPLPELEQPKTFAFGLNSPTDSPTPRGQQRATSPSRLPSASGPIALQSAVASGKQTDGSNLLGGKPPPTHTGTGRREVVEKKEVKKLSPFERQKSGTDLSVSLLAPQGLTALEHEILGDIMRRRPEDYKWKERVRRLKQRERKRKRKEQKEMRSTTRTDRDLKITPGTLEERQDDDEDAHLMSSEEDIIVLNLPPRADSILEEEGSEGGEGGESEEDEEEESDSEISSVSSVNSSRKGREGLQSSERRNSITRGGGSAGPTGTRQGVGVWEDSWETTQRQRLELEILVERLERERQQTTKKIELIRSNRPLFPKDLIVFREDPEDPESRVCIPKTAAGKRYRAFSAAFFFRGREFDLGRIVGGNNPFGDGRNDDEDEKGQETSDAFSAIALAQKCIKRLVERCKQIQIRKCARKLNPPPPVDLNEPRSLKQSIVDFLVSRPPFLDKKKKAVQELALNFLDEWHPQGSVVVRQGERAVGDMNSLFFVRQGRLKILRTIPVQTSLAWPTNTYDDTEIRSVTRMVTEEVGELQVGAFWGSLTLKPRNPRYSVVAAAPVTLARAKTADLLRSVHEGDVKFLERRMKDLEKSDEEVKRLYLQRKQKRMLTAKEIDKIRLKAEADEIAWPFRSREVLRRLPQMDLLDFQETPETAALAAALNAAGDSFLKTGSGLNDTKKLSPSDKGDSSKSRQSLRDGLLNQANRRASVQGTTKSAVSPPAGEKGKDKEKPGGQQQGSPGKRETSGRGDASVDGFRWRLGHAKTQLLNRAIMRSSSPNRHLRGRTESHLEFDPADAFREDPRFSAYFKLHIRDFTEDDRVVKPKASRPFIRFLDACPTVVERSDVGSEEERSSEDSEDAAAALSRRRASIAAMANQKRASLGGTQNLLPSLEKGSGSSAQLKRVDSSKKTQQKGEVIEDKLLAALQKLSPRKRGGEVPTNRFSIDVDDAGSDGEPAKKSGAGSGWNLLKSKTKLTRGLPGSKR
uniref:Cyclic nucleotide-binding domain-containing protein n=1 Tax=Chromera velia CCMP2878 TaxID=1169474 RepID=A0A0G4FVP7_9ALVE|eukprot:Cvel_18866.t1-p1 / transcript=Cvel_18866.t1 / gene=Cvel_18866 / organism=Chromera_velia_CCMP2878 / gene_product=hypothetical protein / transcript_product=hypothetical protein / location=Cvel_scaffold1588:4618-17989(+) / protein_length=1550 / sequence_SO=supercontig / SO=protein_coding / is_pseudo=false